MGGYGSLLGAYVMNEVSPAERSPSFVAYLRRINARVCGLFIAVVGGENQPWEVRENSAQGIVGEDPERMFLHFNRDGGVFAWGALAPTDQERQDIAREFATLAFPTVQKIHSLDPASIPDMIRDATEENLFIFRDQKGMIEFIQVRIEIEEGERIGDKKYIPFTYWSDDVWRKAEPDQGLPFYGLEKVQKGDRVFLHEGAKAARGGQRIATDPGHPFYRLFCTGKHVGWIGGTRHTYRVRWGDLIPIPGDLVIVADNDHAGREKIPEISKRFQCDVNEIMFGGDWPQSWDAADPIPEYMIRDGIYVGPDPMDMIKSAAWATREIPSEGRAPRYAIRPLFASKWGIVIKSRAYVSMATPERMLDKEQFNKENAPFSDVAATADLLAKNPGSLCEEATFYPDRATGPILLNGRRVFNQYRDLRHPAVKGDTKPFDDFLTYLFPIPSERDEIYRWIATLYAKPSVRMGYGILALSEQTGVGKSTLGKIMSRLISPIHTSFPGDAMIQSEFNSWIVNKRLVVVNEIYAGHSWKAYNRLKTLVTDLEIEANEKHMATYSVPNWTHYYCCSNSMEALRIEEKDRRWFVPQLTESRWRQMNYIQLNKWADTGGIGHLAYKLLNMERYVAPWEFAPESEAKDKLIENSMSNDQRMLNILLDRIPPGSALEVNAVWRWLLDNMRGSMYITLPRIPRIAEEQGMKVHWPDMGRPEKFIFRSAEEANECPTFEKCIRATRTPADLLSNVVAM